MVSLSMPNLASLIAFKPVQYINKFGGSLEAVFSEFRMQPQNLFRYLVGFFFLFFYFVKLILLP